MRTFRVWYYAPSSTIMQRRLQYLLRIRSSKPSTSATPSPVHHDHNLVAMHPSYATTSSFRLWKCGPTPANPSCSLVASPLWGGISPMRHRIFPMLKMLMHGNSQTSPSSLESSVLKCWPPLASPILCCSLVFLCSLFLVWELYRRCFAGHIAPREAIGVSALPLTQRRNLQFAAVTPAEIYERLRKTES